MASIPPMPRCTDEIAYRRWWLDLKSVSEWGARYCNDCTPEHKARMLSEKRCSFPETVFVLGDDGVLGVPSNDARVADVLSGALRIIAGPTLDELREKLRVSKLAGRLHRDALSMVA